MFLSRNPTLDCAWSRDEQVLSCRGPMGISEWRGVGVGGAGDTRARPVRSSLACGKLHKCQWSQGLPPSSLGQLRATKWRAEMDVGAPLSPAWTGQDQEAAVERVTAALPEPPFPPASRPERLEL